MVVEENMVELNDQMNELQTIVERIARRLEVVLNALPQRQEVNTKNQQREEIQRIAGWIQHQPCWKDHDDTSESSNNTQSLPKCYRLQKPIMDIQDLEDSTEEEDDV